MKHFTSFSTINDVKTQYRNLAKNNHPDFGGCTATMQEINAEYAEAIKMAAAGQNLNTEETEAEILNAEQYKNALNAIIALEGISIELCGGWLWVSGDTYQHRAIFSANGFFFAGKKKMWYFRSAEYKTTSKKSHTMDQIRTKYGSQAINGKSSYKLSA